MYNILHLEQSQLIRQMVKEPIIEHGLMYVPVYTAQEVYEKIDNRCADLIITSMLIEDESFDEFMKKVNSKNPDIPVFVVTSNNLMEDKKRVLGLGAADYIAKEDLSNELLKHIEVLVQEDQMMENLREARIAVVDDSSFQLDLIKGMLTKRKINNVDFYKSGFELLDSGKNYDLYLIDVILEKEFGKNVVISIRRNNLKASIIVISAVSSNKTIASILNVGADDYIPKPLDESLFIAKLKSNIKTYGLRKNIDKLMKDMLIINK